jgi:hypothetical protein
MPTGMLHFLAPNSCSIIILDISNLRFELQPGDPHLYFSNSNTSFGLRNKIMTRMEEMAPQPVGGAEKTALQKRKRVEQQDLVAEE